MFVLDLLNLFGIGNRMLKIYIYITVVYFGQCFDAVGWVAGRASGL